MHFTPIPMVFAFFPPVSLVFARWKCSAARKITEFSSMTVVTAREEGNVQFNAKFLHLSIWFDFIFIGFVIFIVFLSFSVSICWVRNGVGVLSLLRKGSGRHFPTGRGKVVVVSSQLENMPMNRHGICLYRKFCSSSFQNHNHNHNQHHNRNSVHKISVFMTCEKQRM